MPRRVTMRRRNDLPLVAVFFLLLTSLFLSISTAKGQSHSESPAASAVSSQAPASAPAAQVDTTKNSQQQDSPGKASQDSGQGPEGADSGVFVFRKQVEEVVLHATVGDDKQRIITNLAKG